VDILADNIEELEAQLRVEKAVAATEEEYISEDKDKHKKVTSRNSRKVRFYLSS
jgi:hypothetical protein